MLKSEIKERIRLVHSNHMHQLIPADLYTPYDLEQIGTRAIGAVPSTSEFVRTNDAIAKGRAIVWECIDAVKGEI